MPHLDQSTKPHTRGLLFKPLRTSTVKIIPNLTTRRQIIGNDLNILIANLHPLTKMSTSTKEIQQFQKTPRIRTDFFTLPAELRQTILLQTWDVHAFSPPSVPPLPRGIKMSLWRNRRLYYEKKLQHDRFFEHWERIWGWIEILATVYRSASPDVSASIGEWTWLDGDTRMEVHGDVAYVSDKWYQSFDRLDNEWYQWCDENVEDDLPWW